jgi:hypothetical protein
MRPGKEKPARSIRPWVLAFALALAMPPVPVLAQSAAGTGDRGTDMVLDLLILRPLGLLTAAFGSAAFVVSLPFTLPSGSTGAAACEMVKEPFAYTFTRPLGDLDVYGSDCQAETRR